MMNRITNKLKLSKCNKNVVVFLCSILVLLLLSGCSGNIDTEEINRAENAKKEAIPFIWDHFKSKYGIDIQVESVSAKFSGCGHDNERYYSGHIQATVSYNGSTFSANVENEIVYDNYQAKEIEQACLTYTLDKLNLTQPVFYEISAHYRGQFYYDFEALMVNDYFDGTNIEDFFDMISPSFILAYESDVVFDSAIPEKITVLVQNTAYDKQSIELIIFEKGSVDRISPIRGNNDIAEYYAPYVEYSERYRKDWNMEQEVNQFIVEPLSNDIPIISEFLMRKDKREPDNFVVRQEEFPGDWGLGRNFEQIMPSYHFLWKENVRLSSRIYIPSSIWRELCDKYDDIQLIKYKEYASGKVEYHKLEMNPDKTEYSGLDLYGDFFSFEIDNSTKYITFFGKNK